MNIKSHFTCKYIALNGSSFYYRLTCSSHLKFIQMVLQGAGVTLAELGEYSWAASLLQDLSKVCYYQFQCFIDLMLLNSFCSQNQHIILLELIYNALQEKPSDLDVLRLLGEVKYELKDYEGSAAAYRLSAMVSFLSTQYFIHLVHIAVSGNCSLKMFLILVQTNARLSHLKDVEY